MENDKDVQNEKNIKCRQCKSNVCVCNGEVCTYAYKQYSMKKWVFGIIITVIIIGLIVPFFAEVICTIWVPDASVGLNAWNQFVSIILGIVATILSIVSMIMGFKNYEDGLGLHEKHIQTLEKISTISKDVSDVKSELIAMSTDVKNEKRSITDTLWNHEPEVTII